jgi:hypothetical protein
MATEKMNLSPPTFTDDDVENSNENNSQLIVLNFLKSSVINNPHSVRNKIQSSQIRKYVLFI